MKTEGYRRILELLSSENRLRKIPDDRNGIGILDLTLNDYMGLAKRTAEWRPEFFERFGEVAMTSSASRLLASDQAIFNSLESFLETKFGKHAVLFNSGYHANVGTVQALNIPGTLWVTDKLIHASIIDGIRLARAECKRWNHNDVSHLKAILERNSKNYDRVYVVCESVYSMDGDMAPIEQIVALKKEFPNMSVYLDEAHAIGVIGHNGNGLAAAVGVLSEIDVLVGTLGKACASSGAFVLTSELLRSYLVNTARSLIFSTAMAPINAAWSLFMLEKLERMDSEREHLADISKRFKDGIETITAMPNPSQSAIVPLVTGDAVRAVEISRKLEKLGVLALPIRRPTVPPGGERIRFSLNAAMSERDVDLVLDKIETSLR